MSEGRNSPSFLFLEMEILLHLTCCGYEKFQKGEFGQKPKAETSYPLLGDVS
ncbi:MAG: hypothetical protein K8R06_10300 [Methanosarcinales archaeon]|nr:hypothetical protein [Methanosarcinales archaeon]